MIACAGTGQDGERRTGAVWPVPRFTDNRDGTTTDDLTGLMWLSDRNCMRTNYPGIDGDGTAGDGMVTWQHALDFIAGINNGTYPACGVGYRDWRLPNKKELSSLVDASRYDPVLPAGNPFVNVQWTNPACLYWSSSSTAWFPSRAWILGMNSGHIGFYAKTGDNFVWSVRAGAVN